MICKTIRMLKMPQILLFFYKDSYYENRKKADGSQLIIDDFFKIYMVI